MYIYVYMYVCMYVCMYICMYTYTYLVYWAAAVEVKKVGAALALKELPALGNVNEHSQKSVPQYFCYVKAV